MSGREAPMREERRTVTALFADVAGSTELGERLDPEDVREVVGGAVRRMIEVVERLGGTVKDLAGDGVLALFGAPVAHEDDAERAVLAGLEIQREIGEHAKAVRREHGVDRFGVRVGIESGLVVMGPMGGGSRIEYGATGDVVNVAARLQAQASVGSVLVGPAARGQISPLFSWSEPVALELKGKLGHLEAATALERRLDASRTRRLPGRGAPLVGRDPELATASAMIDRLAEHVGSVLLLLGEAGIGKTRLLETIRASAPAAVRWLDGSCTSFGSSTPYGPLRQLLDSWERLEASRPEDLLPSADEDARSALGGLSGTAGRDENRRFAEMSPDGRQLAIVEGLSSFLRAVAADRPVVVAIEDLHWSDPSSLLALERLVPLAASVPIAFAFTSRLDPDAFVSEVLDRAARSNEVVRVELDELHPGADRELVASLVGASALPPALLQRVLEVGGGNPFFLGELVRSLIDGGALVRSDGEWTLAGDVRPELPPTVDRVLLARIDRLPDVDRAVLTAASVLGRRFSAASLAALLDADPTEAVVRLTAADLVRPEPPDHAFAHVLVQETAYATLLKKRRRELHARAAAAIEAEDARVDEKAAVLGRHHAGAGNDAEALRWFLVAADRAEGLSALLETIDHLDAALPLTDPEGELAASLRLRRGRLRGRTGDHRGARADLDEALRLALARLDRGLEMRCRDEIGFLVAGSADYRESVEHLEHALSIADEIGDAPGRVSALSRLAITWANRLQLDRAKRSADLALETASAAGEDRLVATALDALKQVALELGRFDDLERYGEQIGALYARRNDRWLLQFVEFETGYASIARARLEEGRERLERSLATNRELHDDGNEPLHLAAIGHHHRCRGTLDDAVELGRRACSLARERRHEEWTGWAASELGGTLLLLGAREEAIDVLREGAEAGERSGAELQALRCVGLLVRALARTDMGEVRRLLPAAEARIALITVPEGDRFLLGWDGLVGVAAARLEGGDADRANRAVGRIVEACTTRPWPEAVIDASLVEAAALATLGDAEGALGSARRADEWVRAHPLPAYGWRAAAALATALPDPNEAAQAADRARAAAEALLGTIADASLRRHLEDDVERVLSREATAWA